MGVVCSNFLAAVPGRSGRRIERLFVRLAIGWWWLPVAGVLSAQVEPAAEEHPPRPPLVAAGRCLDYPERQPFVDAEVTLFELQGLIPTIRELARTRTGDDGGFRFADVALIDRPCGSDQVTYAVAVSAPGRAITTSRPNCAAFVGGLTVYVYDGVASLRGQVVNERGEPVSGASIESGSLPGMSVMGLPATTTQEDGLFVLSGLPALGADLGSRLPNTSLRVSHPDYADLIHRVQALEPLRIVLRTGCEVSGSVRIAATGQPLANALLLAYPHRTNSIAQLFTIRTDAAGRFRKVLPEGDYGLVLRADSDFVAAPQEIECRAGTRRTLPPFDAVEGGWIVGQVRDLDHDRPLVWSPNSNDSLWRVQIGAVGPGRPVERSPHREPLAAVDDQGRFRIRVLPGEHYPYLFNAGGARTISDATQHPPVIVAAGQEAESLLTASQPLTPDQQRTRAEELIATLPAPAAERTAAILTELAAVTSIGEDCEDWTRLIRELVRVGPAAVPAVCAALESTENPTAQRQLAFTLRAIGDPRAVPSLIRTLPRTLHTAQALYTLSTQDPELTEFMRIHGHQLDGRMNRFQLGRPVREIHAALERLTGRTVNADEVCTQIRRHDRRARAKQEAAYYQLARDWADWWDANSRFFGVEVEYRQTHLPAWTPPDLSDYPVGLELTSEARQETISSGGVLSPIGRALIGESHFLDLDTGAKAAWPEDLNPGQDTLEGLAAARRWAAEKGYELFCVRVVGGEGEPPFRVMSVNAQVWEIDRFDAQRIDKRARAGTLPTGRLLTSPELLHQDADSGQLRTALNSSFLCLTSEQGLAVVTIVAVYAPGEPQFEGAGAGSTIGHHRGVHLNVAIIGR